MKIFQLNTFCGTGSTGRIAVEIAKAAAEGGAQTVIGFGAGAVSTDAEVYALRVGGKPGRKWHGALRKLLDAEGYGSVLATRKLIAFLREYKPDVIHLHNIHGAYVNHRLLFAYLKKAGVPVVWTLHDCWAFTGHCAYFDRAGCDRWKTLCYDCPQKKSYPVCYGIGGSKRNYNRKRRLFASLPSLTLVAPCVWLQTLLAVSFLRGVPSRLLYNGVDRTRFRPLPSDVRTRYGIGEKRLVLAVASEWEERKGLRFLPALAEKLGDNVCVAVIGLTKEQIAALPAGMIGLERTASVDELAQWYSAADCVVNPTLEDNMPMVNLEALACGTPVVAFDTGGCSEVIDASCGTVVPKGDGDALAVAVKRIITDKASLSPACLKRAGRFDGAACAQAYLSLYREVAR